MRYLFILLIGFIFQGTVTAQNSFSAQLSLPVDLIQGETCTFKLDIFKPENIRGYTVFSQEFPKGFYVKGIELNGAQFSYENNELKLTWLRIPSDAKISVLYEVSPMYGVTGDFRLSGKLNYMIGSNQGVFELKEYTLKVLKEREAKPDNHLKITENYTPLNINREIYKDISCTGKQTYYNKKNEYIIELTIKQNSFGSYSIVEKIPKHFSFTEVSSEGAEVSIFSDKVMYYWKSIPKSKEIIVKYKLIPDEGQSDKPLISGKLSVIKEGKLIDMPVIHL